MSESKQERPIENVRHEYDQVVENLRHFSNLRFVMFAIFFVVIGGVAYIAFGKGQFEEGAVKVARSGGFLIVTVFWLYEERMSLWWGHYRKVAVELEQVLGYHLSSTESETLHFLPSVTLLTRVFFFLIFLFWAYAIGMTP